MVRALERFARRPMDAISAQANKSDGMYLITGPFLRPSGLLGTP